MGKVTIYEVARLANVSIATVSRVLNKKDTVSLESQNKVHKVIKDLGYTPDNIARNLKNRENRTLGFIIRDISNPNYAIICQGAERIARKHSYNMLLCNSHGDVEIEKRYIELLIQQRVAGVAIFLANDQINTVEPLLRNNIPVVLIDSKIEGKNIPRIMSNSYKGTYEGTKYLLSLGHERIGFLAGDFASITGRERLMGYRDALKEHYKKLDEIFLSGSFKQNAGYSQTVQLLENIPKVTAIFAASNQLTIGSLLAIRDKNLRIPNDISFLGFDNTDFSYLTNPPLSIISRSVDMLGSSSMSLLIDIISSNKPMSFTEVVLPIEVIVRNSCMSLHYGELANGKTQKINETD